MDIIVVDSDVIINYSRGKTTSLDKLLLRQDKNEIQLVIPSLVVFEFYSGSSLSQKEIYEKAELLFSKFIVQELTEEIAKIAAKLNRERKLQEKIETSDILIAATCLYLEAKLLTKNRKHFQYIPHLSFA